MKIIKMSQGGKSQGGGYFEVYIEFTFADGHVERYENTVIGHPSSVTADGRAITILCNDNIYLMNEWGKFPAFELPEDPGHQPLYNQIIRNNWRFIS
jgi:hypothetical protein